MSCNAFQKAFPIQLQNFPNGVLVRGAVICFAADVQAALKLCWLLDILLLAVALNVLKYFRVVLALKQIIVDSVDLFGLYAYRILIKMLFDK